MTRGILASPGAEGSRRGLLGLAVLAAAAALCAAGASRKAGDAPEGMDSESREGLELRVLSFNIRYGTAPDGEDRWEKRRERVFSILRRSAPDVAGLQEALRFQLDSIRAALPEYGEVGVGRDDGKTAGEYSAILYRRDRFRVEEEGTFWFSDTPETPGSKSWGNQIPRICSWARFAERTSGRSFYVYNLHLDHISQPSRERSAEYLKRAIARRNAPDPVVITGDFNASEDNPAVLALVGAPRERPFLDTFRVLHPEARDAGTFHGFSGRSSGGKIDYIFVSPELETLDAEILRDHEGGRYPSDHFPVFARVRIPPAPRGESAAE